MKIILATGGSGGHIFPALLAAHRLRIVGHEILFAGALGGAAERIQKQGFNFHPLGARGLSFVSLKVCLRFLFCMIKAAIESFRLLRKFEPDVVCGFGGYGSFPVVFTAVLLRYPTLIHEQNVVPGKANRVLSRVVQKVAVSFEESRKYFRADKTVLTGCPCHGPQGALDRPGSLARFKLIEQRVTFLILGGSQGSHRINEEFIQTVKLLKEELALQVIHVSGKNDYARLNEVYKSLRIPFALFEFLEDMVPAYSAADLVISRAGAVTVSEIAQFQIPAILIPYPYAHGHQKENAKILCRTRAVRMIEENDLSALKLKEAILELMRLKIDKEEIRKQLKGFFIVDAPLRLAGEIERLKV